MRRKFFLNLTQLPRLLANPFRLAALRRRLSLKIHLGCGDDRLDSFVNVDCRLTQAADVTMDLNMPRLATQSVALAYSHAFFEHLYRDARVGHLRRIHDSLDSTGICCYIGLPYFRNIARFYLERAPGIVGPRFDLFNVYRYTHGDPEQVPSWWLEQLHKSLFDETEVADLLLASGFTSFVMFCYAYPGDAQDLPVSMGFYASHDERPAERLQSEAREFLSRVANKKITMQSLEWLPV